MYPEQRNVRRELNSQEPGFTTLRNIKLHTYLERRNLRHSACSKLGVLWVVIMENAHSGFRYRLHLHSSFLQNNLAKSYMRHLLDVKCQAMTSGGVHETVPPNSLRSKSCATRLPKHKLAIRALHAAKEAL